MSKWMIKDKSIHIMHFSDISLVGLKIVHRSKYKNKITGVYSEIKRPAVWIQVRN